MSLIPDNYTWYLPYLMPRFREIAREEGKDPLPVTYEQCESFLDRWVTEDRYAEIAEWYRGYVKQAHRG